MGKGKRRGFLKSPGQKISSEADELSAEAQTWGEANGGKTGSGQHKWAVVNGTTLVCSEERETWGKERGKTMVSLECLECSYSTNYHMRL